MAGTEARPTKTNCQPVFPTLHENRRIIRCIRV